MTGQVGRFLHQSLQSCSSASWLIAFLRALLFVYFGTFRHQVPGERSSLIILIVSDKKPMRSYKSRARWLAVKTFRARSRCRLLTAHDSASRSKAVPTPRPSAVERTP